jgi:phosphatidylserine/phosphatidylglycerophosphate/cardiolipin synthase-like enzyme
MPSKEEEKMLELIDRTFYASPDEDTITPFLAFLNSATKSIHMAIYSITLDTIPPILIAKHNAGLDVQVVVDKSATQDATQKELVSSLISQGLNVLVGTSDKGELIHDKIAIIDGTTSLYGSWNFTKNATEEDNIYVIDSNPQVAAYLESMFSAIYSWVQQHDAQ